MIIAHTVKGKGDGGLGALVAEILSEYSPRRVIRFGINDRWGESAPNEYLLDLFELSPVRLSKRIKQVLQCTKRESAARSRS